MILKRKTNGWIKWKENTKHHDYFGSSKTIGTPDTLFILNIQSSIKPFHGGLFHIFWEVYSKLIDNIIINAGNLLDGATWSEALAVWFLGQQLHPPQFKLIN